MSTATQTCLQCGETLQAVRREKLYCATVSYEGECIEEWNRHRWREWTDTELAPILPEYRHLYRRARIDELMWTVPRAHVKEPHS